MLIFNPKIVAATRARPTDRVYQSTLRSVAIAPHEGGDDKRDQIYRIGEDVAIGCLVGPVEGLELIDAFGVDCSSWLRDGWVASTHELGILRSNLVAWPLGIVQIPAGCSLPHDNDPWEHDSLWLVARFAPGSPLEQQQLPYTQKPYLTKCYHTSGDALACVKVYSDGSVQVAGDPRESAYCDEWPDATAFDRGVAELIVARDFARILRQEAADV